MSGTFFPNFSGPPLSGRIMELTEAETKLLQDNDWGALVQEASIRLFGDDACAERKTRIRSMINVLQAAQNRGILAE